MSWAPQSQTWPGNQAVLFIHGVGDAAPGSYDDLLLEFDKAVGPTSSTVAKYVLYYDDINDWMKDKVNLAAQLKALIALLKAEASNATNDAALGAAIAEFAGDVIMPVLNEAPRVMVRDRILSQLLQIRLDGASSGTPFPRQKISIICHSMGCFHTYEALHAAATNPAFKLRPLSENMQFRSVIFMASPVNLIRTGASKLGNIVPQRGLATVSNQGLFNPFEIDPISGTQKNSALNLVSIVGELDPVGGYFFKDQVPWAYMSMSGQISILDKQSLLNINSKSELTDILWDLAVNGKASPNALRNPHAWDAYIRNHGSEIAGWIA